MKSYRSAMSRLDANRCRMAPASSSGHYESYFLRANHPQRPLAFWLRHTLFRSRNRPEEAVGELWAVVFDGERDRIAAIKQAWPIAACRIGRDALDLAIGGAHLGGDRAIGSVAHKRPGKDKGQEPARYQAGRIDWSLMYDAPQPPLLLLPQALYRAPFPPAKALVAAPNALFTGTIDIDGERLPVGGWRGSQNHNWGSRHTDSYCWGQVAGFDNAPGAFLECSTANIKLGPLGLPALTLVVLRLDGKEYALNGLRQALRTRARSDFVSWEIDAADPKADVHIAIRMEAPRAAFAGLRYPNPPGGSKTCLNTKLARCDVTLTRRGRSPRKLVSASGGAFEILTDRTDHGVALLA